VRTRVDASFTRGILCEVKKACEKLRRTAKTHPHQETTVMKRLNCSNSSYKNEAAENYEMRRKQQMQSTSVHKNSKFNCSKHYDEVL
jgi:hypothetical protein